MNALVFDESPDLGVHEGVVIRHAAGPIGAEGAQFGRVHGRMEDEMGDAHRQVGQHLFGDFQLPFWLMKGHHHQAVDQGHAL